MKPVPTPNHSDLTARIQSQPGYWLSLAYGVLHPVDELILEDAIDAKPSSQQTVRMKYGDRLGPIQIFPYLPGHPINPIEHPRFIPFGHQQFCTFLTRCRKYDTAL